MVVHVAIIGGGISGLMAARTLLSSGFDDIKVTILEATSELGGRIKSDDGTFIGDGHFVDLGAEFVHGGGTVLTTLVQEENWDFEDIFITAQGDGGPDDMPTKDKGMYGAYYLGRTKTWLPYDSTDSDFLELNDVLEELHHSSVRRPIKEEVEASAAQNDDGDDHYLDDENRSLGDYLADNNISEADSSSRLWGLIVSGYANTAACTDVFQLSYAATRAYETYWSENELSMDFRINSKVSMYGVVKSTIESIIGDKRLTIKVGWKAHSIDYSGSNNQQILIESASSSSSCSSSNDQRDGTSSIETVDACIISVPVSILHRREITFNPPLPEEKIKGFDMLGMEGAVKILLKFSEPLWPNKLQSLICADSFVPEFWFRSFSMNDGSTIYVAVGFFTSKHHSLFISLNEKEAVDRCIRQLSEMFGVSLLDEKLLDYKIYDWSKNEGVKGGYSFPKVGITPKHFKDMASSVDDKLYFCGEGTHLGAPMTVQAGMETGMRAAKEVLAHYSFLESSSMPLEKALWFMK